MEDMDCSFDELLYRSLSSFRQHRLYDDCIEHEENAFQLLREAEKRATASKDGICIAKLGCVVECLAHKFYIEGNTDRMLGDVDDFLIKYWKEAKKPSPESFIISLWVGKYFLLRLKNVNSRVRSRSKKMLSKILEYMADMLRKPEKQKVLYCSTTYVLEETLDWVKEICDIHVCEKQIVVLLKRLYYLQENDLLEQTDPSGDSLRLRIWEFYY